ncbi:unnamed protein product [Adineta ricciae]|uniref:Carbohydrate sulfotransferase n=1 Tax=Adineta ricciae TaxID=249248 RepID=A0A815CLE5_ADIRI|nr:unnamed protein product [Adineta ricciae]CAF1285853.1 unnamed protein product [Adineta ricciae]
MFRYYRRLVLIGYLILVVLFIRYLTSKPSQRKFQQNKYCQNKNLRIDEEFYSNLVYIPSLNVLFCDVPKAASTNLRRLLIGHLNQSESYVNLDRKKIWIDYEKFFQQFYLTKTTFHQLFHKSNKNLFKFLIARHPFQRIYSVYYDKFVNNHLDDTLFGWKQLEEDILLEINKNYTLITIRRYDIRLDLRTFLLYIVDSIRKHRLINSHWEQIVRRCAVCWIDYDFFGKIENFHNDGKILLKKFNENAKQIQREFPSKELDKKQTKQIQLNNSQLFQLFRENIQNDDDFKVLVDYYTPDFQIFNYSLSNF